MARERKTQTLELDDAVVTSTQLPYEESEDLLPEIMQIVSALLGAAAPVFLDAKAEGKLDLEDPKTVLKLAPVLPALAAQIGGGKLKRLAPAILAGTTVTLTDPDTGTKEKCDLVTKEGRATCFEARPDLYLPILFFAGKVSFGGYFPGVGKKKSKSLTKPTPTTA